MTYQILKGNSLDLLPTLADNSIDAIVTDPPYGLGNPDPDYIIKAIQLWASGDRAHIPEGKGFMGKSWDSFVPPPAIWDECLRVLKPGGHLLAFAGTRTYDLMGISIRMAGFEIRDSIGWVYGSGFPKSLNVSKAVDDYQNKHESLLPDEERFCSWMKDYSGLTEQQSKQLLGSARFITGQIEIVNTATKEKPRMGRRAMVPTSAAWEKIKPNLANTPPDWVEELVKNPPQLGITHPGQWNAGKGQGTTGNNEWQGWGTALKPALEPIVVARKPLIGTVAENVLTHGTGGLNIDASRIGTETMGGGTMPAMASGDSIVGRNQGAERKENTNLTTGRWPANLILDEYTAELLDEQSGDRKGMATQNSSPVNIYGGNSFNASKTQMPEVRQGYNDSGGASRFFYVAKASKRDRNEGLEDLPAVRASAMGYDIGLGESGEGMFKDRNPQKQNFHPTVKPTELMRYLVKLITPPGGTVLDPFTGSGSTGKAAILEGFDFIGIELTEDYWPIIEGRLKHAEAKVAERIKETSDQEQEKLF
jgi:DNA modification methylase